jgi:hypothetical protein
MSSRVKCRANRWSGCHLDVACCRRDDQNVVPASSPSRRDFFNSLLVLLSQKAAWCGRGSEA